MKYISFPFLLLISIFTSSAQVRIDSISHLNYQTLHNTQLNDIWGYTDETGKEYALVGAQKGTSVVDISNPANPVEIFWEPGLQSVWRDLKTWGDYAYITTEAANGLLILDLTSLPNAAGISASYYEGVTGQTWQSAHNLYIDEHGYAYIFGANRGNGGVIILDVHTDPLNPIEVGVFDDWYCHDGYVRNNIMYLSHITDGFLSLVDVSDKSNPILLGTKNTPSNFTHNSWPDDSGNRVYTTDEVSGGYLAAYDVSDPENIQELDRIQSSPGAGIVPHNTHFLNDYIITSYYGDGVTIHDVSNSEIMVEVGSYDTYPGQPTTTTGCWGVYPYLNSGLILATDIDYGLFILQPTYVRGSFLTGTVTDATTNQPLSNVEVKFESHNQTEFTGSNGSYKTGIDHTGLIDITFSKLAYFPQTVTVNLTEAQTVVRNIELVSFPPFTVQFNVADAETNDPIFDASILLNGELISHQQNTNGVGESIFTLFYQEEYLVTVGKWGYKSGCQNIVLDEATGTITLFLEKGYYDDFVFDFGWTTTAESTVTSGEWVREVPHVVSVNARPSTDAAYDCGGFAFLTGNTVTGNPNNDDVTGGRVTLYSPIFDLTDYQTPYIHYHRWFYNFHGPILPYDDTLEIFLSNGVETVLIDSQHSDPETFFKWNQKVIDVNSVITPTESMQLIITVADEEPRGNITEAGFDFFFVSEINQLEIEENTLENHVQVFPNPATNQWHIHANQSANWKLIDNSGRVIQAIGHQNNEFSIQAEHFPAGIYFLTSELGTFRLMKSDQ